LAIGSVACDSNDTIGIPSEQEIFDAEVAVAVLSVIDIFDRALIQPPDEEPEPSPALGVCEIIPNADTFFCNEGGDIQECGEDLFEFNACDIIDPPNTILLNGSLGIGENETWPTGTMSMDLVTLVSAANYAMTFDGTTQVSVVYSDAFVTSNCLVTLSKGLNFEAVASCEDVG